MLTQFMISGHGTYVENDEVISSVAGTVERVNKLITVRAARTRYDQINLLQAYLTLSQQV